MFRLYEVTCVLNYFKDNSTSGRNFVHEMCSKILLYLKNITFAYYKKESQT